MHDSTKRDQILVIDDSPDYLHFMEVLLEAEGFVVSALSSTDSLSEIVAQRRPDLVITDVCLPGMPPFATLDLLAAGRETASIPVLVCTGAVNELAGQAERLNAPHVGLLMKPFDVGELLTKIAALLPETHTPSPV